MISKHILTFLSNRYRQGISIWRRKPHETADLAKVNHFYLKFERRQCNRSRNEVFEVSAKFEEAPELGETKERTFFFDIYFSSTKRHFYSAFANLENCPARDSDLYNNGKMEWCFESQSRLDSRWWGFRGALGDGRRTVWRLVYVMAPCGDGRDMYSRAEAKCERGSAEGAGHATSFRARFNFADWITNGGLTCCDLSHSVSLRLFFLHLSSSQFVLQSHSVPDFGLTKHIYIHMGACRGCNSHCFMNFRDPQSLRMGHEYTGPHYSRRSAKLCGRTTSSVC